MIDYKINTATENDVYKHLVACDDLFIPRLSEKVNLKEYADKIFEKADTFEAWKDNKLIGLIAGYFNNINSKRGFITNVSVLEGQFKQGIASHLLSMVKENSVQKGLGIIALEVNPKNEKALNLYKKHNFYIKSQIEDVVTMESKII